MGGLLIQYNTLCVFNCLRTLSFFFNDLGLAPGGGIVRGGGGGGTQSCEVKNTSKIGFQNAFGLSSGPCKVPELRIELAVPKFHAQGHDIGLKA